MNLKFSIIKRFRCPQCNYLSSAGFLGKKAACPWCKISMKREFYRQYKDHCELIRKEV